MPCAFFRWLRLPGLVVACCACTLAAWAQPRKPTDQGQLPPIGTPTPRPAPTPNPTRPSSEGGYSYAAPPNIRYNRIYRVNRTDGEVIACQYAREPGIGRTVCFPSGEGAGPQASGDYALLASHHREETGIFRVNRRTGQVSLCYVPNDKTVCTAPAP